MVILKFINITLNYNTLNIPYIFKWIQKVKYFLTWSFGWNGPVSILPKSLGPIGSWLSSCDCTTPVNVLNIVLFELEAYVRR